MDPLSTVFHLLLLLQLVLLPSPIHGQCIKPTKEVILGLLHDHLELDFFNLTRYNFSCLSTGGVRDMYTQASIIVKLESNVAIEDCNPSSAGCTGFFHILCADDSPTWILDEIDPLHTLQLTNEANLEIQEPRRDCAACTYLGFFTPNFQDSYDNKTHCYCKIICIIRNIICNYRPKLQIIMLQY